MEHEVNSQIALKSRKRGLHVDPVQPPPCRELRLQRFPREENHPQAVAKLSTPPRRPVRWRGWRGGRRRRNGERARCGEGFQAQISKTAAHDPHYSLLYHLQVGLPRPDADKTAHDRGARPIQTRWHLADLGAIARAIERPRAGRPFRSVSGRPLFRFQVLRKAKRA